MQETERNVKIAGRPFRLRQSDVRRAMRAIDPEPIASHFVVVDMRRFPPKQVISEVTGLDRADFTTHQARRTLLRLGFPAGRRSGAVTGDAPRDGGAAPDGERLADRLRPLAGRWVAVKDDDLLNVADSPQRLVAWLAEHGREADSVFRVPEDELSATGLAPL
jgi:hypothetical protein